MLYILIMFTYKSLQIASGRSHSLTRGCESVRTSIHKKMYTFCNAMQGVLCKIIKTLQSSTLRYRTRQIYKEIILSLPTLAQTNKNAYHKKKYVFWVHKNDFNIIIIYIYWKYPLRKLLYARVEATCIHYETSTVFVKKDFMCFNQKVWVFYNES